METDPRSRLGSYTILSQLGAGGMGEVYRARDERSGLHVAVKLLPSYLSSDEISLRRFEREARVLASIAHPNVVGLLEYSCEPGSAYVVMELLEGETLRARLADGPLERTEARRIALAVASGLAAAHAHGIVHRDLKPENVFLVADGRVQVLDFGLARLVADGEIGNAATTEELVTRPGTVLGTVYYMSPEQVRGGVADERSDVFSFGCLLYELLTGRPPFARPTAAETMAAILRDAPRGLARRALTEGTLERVAATCLAKEPSMRYRSATELVPALEAAGKAPPGDRPARVRKAKTVSVAVLPLVNVTGDPEIDYLCDGITDCVIEDLSQAYGLRVIARSTAFRYRGKDVDPRSAGRELKVRVVLAGSVLHRKDALVVQAELIDVRDGTRIWGERYDRAHADILEVQEQIARDVCAKLRPHLEINQQGKAGRRHTESVEAYHLFLRARYLWGKRSAEGFAKSIECSQRALELDPNYAMAHVGLADAYAAISSYGMIPPGEVVPKARAAATRAAEIDESLAEPHNTLGLVAMSYDWDWPGAEQRFVRALRLNPNYASAHHWYGFFLTVVGRHEEAIAAGKRALALDPLSLIVATNVGWFHHFARDYDRAIAQYEWVLELEPMFYRGYWNLGWAYEQMGMIAKAVESFRAAVRIEPNITIRASLARSLALAGDVAEARRLLGEIEAEARNSYVSPCFLADVYEALGETDRTFELLERAYEDHSFFLVFLKVDPKLDRLRADPRFADLLRRIRLGD